MKNFKLYKTALLFLLIATIFISCEDVVEIELNDENIDLISVEAYLTSKANDNIWVKLVKSLPVTAAEQNPAIHNALIEISDNQNTPNTVFLVEDGNSGIYKLPENTAYNAVPGRTYRIKITTDDGVTIEGQDYLQKVEPLDSVKINLSARGDYNFLAVFINAQETPGPGHYYKWDIFINGNLMYQSEYLTFVSDELVEGNYVSDFEIFTDFYNTEDDTEQPKFNMGDTVYVEQLSISRSTYDFYFGMMNQAFSGSPFSVPPANLPGNLSTDNPKKVLGFFSARDVSEGNTIVIDSTNYMPLTPGITFQP